MTTKMLLVLLVLLLQVWLRVASAAVTLSNKAPRRDTEGNIIDCHDGNIVGPVNGTYFLYGEWYGDSNFVVGGQTDLPKLSVYTSPTLAQGSWVFQGLLHNNTEPGWGSSPHWPWAPHGAWYSPSAIWSPALQNFVIYWSASQAQCCDAWFGIAQSADGIHFDLVTMHGLSGLNVSTDDSSLMIDDDGVGYVAYTAMYAGEASGGAVCSSSPQPCPSEPGRTFCQTNHSKDQCHHAPAPCPACPPAPHTARPPHPAHSHNHMVAIDRLSPDLLSSTGETVAVLPDYFVEGAMLFRRKGRYYVIYGSCCCACKVGSGAVVSSATNIAGPWTRQPRDVNCQADAPVCAGYIRQGDMPAERHHGNLTISAQG